MEISVDSCWNCPFLNSSDTGEDCNILKMEDYYGNDGELWSNIGYFDDEQDLRHNIYEKCPLKTGNIALNDPNEIQMYNIKLLR